MCKELVNTSRQVAENFLPASGLAESNGEAAVGDRRNLIDDSESDDVARIAGIVNARERGKNIFVGLNFVAQNDYFKPGEGAKARLGRESDMFEGSAPNAPSLTNARR